MPVKTYPIAGSNAERVLSFIQANEGTTKNKIITKLGMNPGVVKKAMTGLIDAGLVTDKMDGEGNHHYIARTPAL